MTLILSDNQVDTSTCYMFHLLLLLLSTAIEFSLGGSSSYTSTDKTNNIHKRNNTKHSKYRYKYYQKTHT